MCGGIMPRLFVVGASVAEEEKLESGGRDGLEVEVADWRMRAHVLPGAEEGESAKRSFPAVGEASSKNGEEEEDESLGGLYSESKVRGWRSTFSRSKVL